MIGKESIVVAICSTLTTKIQTRIRPLPLYGNVIGHTTSHKLLLDISQFPSYYLYVPPPHGQLLVGNIPEAVQLTQLYYRSYPIVAY